MNRRVRKYLKLFSAYVERVDPRLYVILYNLYFLKKTWALTRVLNRMEDFFRHNSVQYYINGSLISYALQGGLFPKDIDFVVIWNGSREAFRRLLTQHSFKIHELVEDTFHLSKDGVIVDILLLRKEGDTLQFIDGFRNIHATFVHGFDCSHDGQMISIFGRMRPRLPNYFLWYFLHILSNLNNHQGERKKQRRMKLLSLLLPEGSSLPHVERNGLQGKYELHTVHL